MTRSDYPAGHCTSCGRELQGDEPAGLCPRCLLQSGLLQLSPEGLHIRCPQCAIAIEIVDDSVMGDVTCPSCDSRFNLAGECAVTLVQDQGGKIGRFELLERVGIGAFGTVWKARDPQLDRIVALKLPRKADLSAEETEQFLREARAAGQLKHPGIVAVHEVGRDADRIYIVSDFIQGVTLADSLTVRQPDIRQSVELCRKVAVALDHAHQKGVVHRDLKPSNIMLDEAGEPHVMDFGLAKRETAEITMTMEGRVLGTPAYMSPEQARGDAHHADARSDVYSLGVILFELLTGEKPFRGSSQMLLNQVLQEEPPSPRKFNSYVSTELETVCLKCLQKEPEQRFASALLLADELQRFLRGEPILSRPVSATRRLSRWISRNPVTAGLIGAVAASVLIGLAATVWQGQIAKRNFAAASLATQMASERQRETQAALNESGNRLMQIYVERGLQQIDTNPHAGLPWLLHALQAEPHDSPRRDLHRLRMGLMLRQLPALLGFWSEAAHAQFGPDGSSLAVAQHHTVFLFRLPNLQPVAVLPHSQPVNSVAFSPDGLRLATLTAPPAGPPLCRIWNARTGAPQTEAVDVSDREYGLVDTPTMHFTPDGTRLTLIIAGMYNRWHSKMSVRVFDSSTLKLVSPTFAHHSDLDYVTGYHRLSPDALRVLVPRGTAVTDITVPWDKDDFPESSWRTQQYDLMTAKPVHPPLEHPSADFYSLPVYSHNGSQLATSGDGNVRIWNAATGELVQELKLEDKKERAHVIFHPDHSHIFIVAKRTATLHDISTGSVQEKWLHENAFFVAPSARFIVWADPNGTSYIRDITSDKAKSKQLPDFHNVQFSPDDTRFILYPAGHTQTGVFVAPPAQVFESSSGQPLTPPWRFESSAAWTAEHHRPAPVSEPFSSNGRFLLVQQEAGIWLWDLNARTPLLQPFPSHRQRPLIDAAFTQDHRHAVILTDDLQASTWDLTTGSPVHPEFAVVSPGPPAHTTRWHWMIVNQKASRLAIAASSQPPASEHRSSLTHSVQLWDLARGQLVADALVLDQTRRTSIDGMHFVMDDTRLVVTELVRAEGETPADAAAARDVTRLHILDLHTGTAVDEPREFPSEFHILSVSSDGHQCLVYRAAATAEPGESPSEIASPFVQMYDCDTWKPVSPRMTPETGMAHNAALTPDARHLVMGRAEIWEVAGARRISPALSPHRNVGEFVFQQDSQVCCAVADASGSYWNHDAVVIPFRMNGRPFASPMQNPGLGSCRCAIDAHNRILAVTGNVVRLWDLQHGLALSGAISPAVPGQSPPADSNHHTAVFTPENPQLYLEYGGDLMVLRWTDLIKELPSDDELAAWSLILSGQRADDHGGLIPLTTNEVEDAWKQLQQARLP